MHPHTFMLENRRHQYLGLADLLISNNSNNTWHEPGIISSVSLWDPKQPLRSQVKMFFLHNFNPFYILASETFDLSKNPHLRLLQLDLRLNIKEIRKSQDDVIRWFNSICESVTSKSLVVEVRNFSIQVGICDKIQDTLLGLRKRIETFSVYLTPGTEEKGLFSKLYEVGIVIEEDIWNSPDKKVGHSIPTSYLLSSSLSFLAFPSFPPMSFYSIPKFPAGHIRMYVSTCD